jgi:hypothetical protein
VSIDVPTFTGRSLEELVELGLEASGKSDSVGSTFLFDEVQYLHDWERHLKVLVDTHPGARFIVSGSAAAALRLRSIESGAGRFTEFHLPPLKFCEYLEIKGRSDLAGVNLHDDPPANQPAVEELNKEFVEYANSGGFPEAVVDERVRSDSSRYLRDDVIDKVLLRDLPSLYGIQDIAELNRFFQVLAWNTSQEVSLDRLAKKSGVAKNTIRRYLEYLEAAFLVERLERVDHTRKRFQRKMTFKVYLTNPSIRAALFAPEPADGEGIGAVIETAVHAQFPRRFRQEVTYARWEGARAGEIDFVAPDSRGVFEVKWSDSAADRVDVRLPLVWFCKRHGIKLAFITSRTTWRHDDVDGFRVRVVPASLLALDASRAQVAQDLRMLAPDAFGPTGD